MPRIIAIDYGRKRVGLAVTDPLQLIANTLTTVEETSVIPFLVDYLSKEEVEVIVVGKPMRLDGSQTHASLPVAMFVNLLKQKFPGVRIESLDERFTSLLARRALVDMGLKKKDREKKENTDQVSAALILQTYLDMNPKI